MDARNGSLRKLSAFLIDAFAIEELALIVEAWDRQVAAALPNIRTISLREYVHALVAEVWRHRRWTGKDGLLFQVHRARPRRQRELLSIFTELSIATRPRGAPPSPPPAPATPEREELHRVVLASSPIDLIALIRAHLRAPGEHWAAGGRSSGSTVLDRHDNRRLYLAFSARAAAVEAWPHLIEEGRVLTQARIVVEQPSLYFYCPRGRARPPEFRLALHPTRCRLSRRCGSVRYTLDIEPSPVLSLSAGAL